MNITSIKKTVDAFTMEQLIQAEQDLLNDIPLQVDIEGYDEGEKLTHILAAIFCKHEMEKQEININQAIRLYSQRVRGSIE